jgi:bifunctional N-acetylglucosamine-1-phosphate-uridyltransferase/glucosamine-1-phosphate-acetyltransferase GlmU-like protein
MALMRSKLRLAMTCYALQAEQLGTGHAVMMAQPLLEGKADTLGDFGRYALIAE